MKDAETESGKVVLPPYWANLLLMIEANKEPLRRTHPTYDTLLAYCAFLQVVYQGRPDKSGHSLAERLLSAVARGASTEALREAATSSAGPGAAQVLLDEIQRIQERTAKTTRQETARKAAAAKHANSPAKAARDGVFKKWQEWQSKPHLYRGPTEFAQLMRESFAELKSDEVVMRWARKWKAEAQLK